MTKSVLVAGLSLLAVSALPAAAQTTAPASAPAPSSVQTGGAAASLPNTFDTPVEARATGPVQGPAASAASSPEVVAAAETALKTTIAALENSAPNYGDMSPELATRMRDRADQLSTLVKGFGVLQSVTHVGTENGAELFAVTFDKAATQWIIAQDPQHKIRALLFRPAPIEPVAAPASAAPKPTTSVAPAV